VISVDFDEVSVEDVSRHFGRRRAVSRIGFRAARGTILGLLGPNGAGKSTLLAMLATLLRPSSGRIRYGGFEASAGPALRSRIGVLGHDLFLYPELTAQENLAFFGGLYGLAEADARACTALERAGLATRADDPVSSLSRGMRPRLALLDEPFTGLDDASTGALVGRLRELRECGTIVVLATHDLDLAEGLLDHAIFLRDGRAVDTIARPETLRATYRRVIGRENSKRAEPRIERESEHERRREK
jgi:ABC-type multidrug transport system ATPase subunit